VVVAEEEDDIGRFQLGGVARAWGEARQDDEAEKPDVARFAHHAISLSKSLDRIGAIDRTVFLASRSCFMTFSGRKRWSQRLL
jgi:hypothetical protein